MGNHVVTSKGHGNSADQRAEHLLRTAPSDFAIYLEKMADLHPTPAPAPAGFGEDSGITSWIATFGSAAQSNEEQIGGNQSKVASRQ